MRVMMAPSCWPQSTPCSQWRCSWSVRWVETRFRAMMPLTPGPKRIGRTHCEAWPNVGTRGQSSIGKISRRKKLFDIDTTPSPGNGMKKRWRSGLSLNPLEKELWENAFECMVFMANIFWHLNHQSVFAGKSWATLATAKIGTEAATTT